MIDRGDIRQAIDRYSNIELLRALVMVGSSIRLTYRLKFKEAGGTWSEKIDV